MDLYGKREFMEQDMKYIYTIYKKQSISKAAEALY